MGKKDHLLRNILAVLIVCLGVVFFVSSVKSDPADNLPVVVQELVKPPFVPRHNIVAKGGPKVIKVRMTVTEKVLTIDNEGTKFRVFAFNDSIPDH